MLPDVARAEMLVTVISRAFALVPISLPAFNLKLVATISLSVSPPSKISTPAKIVTSAFPALIPPIVIEPAVASYLILPLFVVAAVAPSLIVIVSAANTSIVFVNFSAFKSPSADWVILSIEDIEMFPFSVLTWSFNTMFAIVPSTVSFDSNKISPMVAVFVIAPVTVIVPLIVFKWTVPSLPSETILSAPIIKLSASSM